MASPLVTVVVFCANSVDAAVDGCVGEARRPRQLQVAAGHRDRSSRARRERSGVVERLPIVTLLPALMSCQVATETAPLPSKVVMPPVRLNSPLPTTAPLKFDSPFERQRVADPDAERRAASASSIESTAVEAVTETV